MLGIARRLAEAGLRGGGVRRHHGHGQPAPGAAPSSSAPRESWTWSSPPTSTTRAARGSPTRSPPSRPACARSSPRSASWAAARCRRAPPATWPPRTSCRCFTRWATTPASTSRALVAARRARRSGCSAARSAATCSPPGPWIGRSRIVSVAELRHDVETLAGMVRDSAGAGERASADWAADRLRQLGADDVRVEPYRYQSTFALAQGAHFAAGALAALRGRRLLAAAALASFELDYSGRAQWSRGAAARGRGRERDRHAPGARRAHAHAGARGAPRRRPHRADVGSALARRRRRRGRAHRQARVAGAAARAGAARRGGGRPRGTRRAAAAILAAAVALSADQARSPTVPGANDNASGVAGVLAVAGRLARDRPAGLEVVVLLCGSEESGMGGMGGLDALGGPGARLGHDARARPRHRGLGRAGGARGRGRPLAGALPRGGRGVRRAGGRQRRRARCGAGGSARGRTPFWPGWAGSRRSRSSPCARAASPTITCPQDTPEQVDYGCLEACVNASAAIARAHAA